MFYELEDYAKFAFVHFKENFYCFLQHSKKYTLFALICLLRSNFFSRSATVCGLSSLVGDKLFFQLLYNLDIPLTLTALSILDHINQYIINDLPCVQCMLLL